MDAQSVECLRCGTVRDMAARVTHVEHEECPRCGYLGWTYAGSLDERERRVLRLRPPERRRLRVA